MTGHLRRGGGVPAAMLLAAVFVCAAPASGQPERGAFRGRPLADALRKLQADGLRIVFSSSIVTPDMRVQAEPRGRTPRQRLDELLAPHGLKAQEGPGAIVQVVRATPADDRRARPEAAAREAPRRDAAIHNEHITVTPPRPYRRDRGVASEASLDRGDIEQLRGDLVDHPFRAVQAFPRVAAVDDFSSEFAVRGSPFRHVDVVVDGVSTPWLQHMAHGRTRSGSLAMITGHALERASVQSGAYPRRDTDRLGAQLDLTLREGSRSHARLLGAVGGTNASVVGEGPIGRSGHGSWLVAARHSYAEWPAERVEATRYPFGFSDGLAKLVYDATPHQRIDLTVLGGTSNIDGGDAADADELGDGTNRAAAVNLAWRSMLGASGVLTQRAHIVKHHFANQHQPAGHVDRGSNEQIGYRADLARPIFRGLLEVGGQIGRIAARYDPGRAESGGHPASAGGFAASAWQRAGYAHFVWTATPTLTLSPGLRVSDSTLLPDRAVSRWLLAEWRVRPGWALNASAGVSYQLPEPRHAWDAGGGRELRPERAAYVDVGLEQRLTESIRWQVGIFTRRERDVLREPDVHPRLVGGVLAPQGTERYVNALRGSAHGVELVVDRRSATGLSGWAAYSYGKTRYTDVDRAETFWADFDQRHALNVLGTYRFSARGSVGAMFRTGTNYPISASVERRDGGLFVAHERNRLRLPAYARLDVRADRGFEYLGRRLLAFVEVINVLDRENIGRGYGTIDLTTGKATGFTETLFRRRASAGFLIEF